jgi:hypothetical protein
MRIELSARRRWETGVECRGKTGDAGIGKGSRSMARKAADAIQNVQTEKAARRRKKKDAGLVWAPDFSDGEISPL